MTTGSTVVDSRVGFQRGYTIWPQGWHTNLSIVPVGVYDTKTWTGTDRPHVKRRFDKFRLYRRETGKWYSFKRRADAPTRLKNDDHPYSCSITLTRSSGYIQQWDSIYGYPIQTNWEVTGVLSPVVDPAGDWNSNDTLGMLDKLRVKVAGSDFNAGVFLGEGREALSMIMNSAVRIRKALSYVKRGNVILAAKALGQTWNGQKIHKSISANWLELQYGWLPLLSDAKSGAEFLAARLEFPFLQTYKVKRTKKRILSQAVAAGQNGYVNGVTRYQILARLSEVDPYKLSGLTDPASVVWELVPYSFVADWFLPIGNYLAGRGLASALSGSFVVTQTTTYDMGLSGGSTSDTNYTFTYTGLSAWSRSIVVSRTVNSTLQVPLPTWKPLSKVASWKHCANAVALLTQKVF